MKIRATPTADPIGADGRIELYARTGSDGQPELVLYNPNETHEWINAEASSAVELEDYR